MTSIVDSPIPADLAESVGRVSALLTAAPLGVAFSGGVDSSVLLALAVRTLGPDQVVAILGVSPSLGTDDRRAAHKVAAYIGVRLVEVQTREGEAEAYRVNGPDRCFHCKTELFSRIEQDVAPVYGLAAVPYGENADDGRRPDRPGSRAAVNHKVLRPLADGGLDKATVRAIARALRLPSADSGGAVPGFPDSTFPGGHRGEACSGRNGRTSATEPRFSRLESAPSRRGGPHRAARSRSAAGCSSGDAAAAACRSCGGRLSVRRNRHTGHPVWRIHVVGAG